MQEENQNTSTTPAEEQPAVAPPPAETPQAEGAPEVAPSTSHKTPILIAIIVLILIGLSVYFALPMIRGVQQIEDIEGDAMMMEGAGPESSSGGEAMMEKEEEPTDQAETLGPNATIEEQLNAGLSLAEIAELRGVSAEDLMKEIDASELERPPQLPTPETEEEPTDPAEELSEDASAEEKLNAGLSVQEVAEDEGVSVEEVMEKIDESELERPPQLPTLPPETNEEPVDPVEELTGESTLEDKLNAGMSLGELAAEEGITTKELLEKIDLSKLQRAPQ